MALTKELSVSISFADSTKRALKFTGVPDSAEATLKAKLRAIKNGTDGASTTFSNWKEYLLSSGGATATGIASATYTETDVTPIYDSATYNG